MPHKYFIRQLQLSADSKGRSRVERGLRSGQRIVWDQSDCNEKWHHRLRSCNTSYWPQVTINHGKSERKFIFACLFLSSEWCQICGTLWGRSDEFIENGCEGYVCASITKLEMLLFNFSLLFWLLTSFSWVLCFFEVKAFARNVSANFEGHSSPETFILSSLVFRRQIWYI